MLLKNTDIHTRTWGHLAHADTRTTLRLAPGEEADVLQWKTTDDGVELVEPDRDFADVHLKPVTKRKSAPEPAATPIETKE